MGKATFTVTGTNFRLYEDGTESGSTPIEAEKRFIIRDALSMDSNLHIRILLQETGGASGAITDDYQLQYNLNSAGWNNITSSSSVVKGFNSINLTDGGATTNRGTNGITDGTGSFVAGKISEDGLLDDFQLTASNFTEVLYSVTLVSADLSFGDTINFQILLNGSVIVGPWGSSTLVIVIASAAYYFDGSDAAAAQSGTSWLNINNADDGDILTYSSSGVNGTETTNYLQLEGTNAPSSSDTINAVKIRCHTGSTTVSWQTIFDLTAPGSGWTWNTIQGLELRLAATGLPLSPEISVWVYEDGNAGGTELWTTATFVTQTNQISYIQLLLDITPASGGGEVTPTRTLLGVGV